MLLREMLPHQLQKAIDEGRVLLVPAGVIELHGPQLPFGTDTLFAEAVCQGIVERLPAVIAPTIDYGPTGYALSGPDRGTLHVGGEAFSGYVKEVLRNLWRMGWRKVVVIVHHQGPEGPEALSFRKAAAEVTFEELHRERGDGWWGDQPPELHGQVWDRLSFGSTVLPSVAEIVLGDHAGIWETSLMLHLRPDLVRLDRVDDVPYWYVQNPESRAADATAERGAKMLETMVGAWVEALQWE
jgi:creatinine amidohydrolase